MKIEPIETERLRLRGFTPADAAFALSIWNDPEMGEYLLDECMETVSDEYFREIQALGDDEQCCYLIAEDKTTGERIGTCSFIPEDGVCDIAYCVSKEHWRKGYATEMAMALRDCARRRGAKKLTILIFQGNDASIAIAGKLGCHIAAQRPYEKCGRTLTEYRYEADL